MTPIVWIITLAALFAGILVGFLCMGWWHRRSPDRRALETLRAEHDRYRRDVEVHFGKTSELFRGLNDQYRSLYEHMASGATSLCASESRPPELELASGGLLPATTREPVDVTTQSPTSDTAGPDPADADDPAYAAAHPAPPEADEGEEAAADARVAADSPAEEEPTNSAAESDAAAQEPGPARHEAIDPATSQAPEETPSPAVPDVPATAPVADSEGTHSAPDEPPRTLH